MKKCIFTILDGVGDRKEFFGNALLNANMNNFNKLIDKYSYSLLDASGEAVGLPKGQMGNSEVGHLTIGSGRIIKQPLHKINSSIKDGSFYNNSSLLDVIHHVKNNNSKIHIFGLLSDGGIHSHINHIFSILDTLKMNNVSNVYLHMFTDGRDTLYNCCLKYFDMLDSYMKNNSIGKLATISGRYYAMDRELWWDRTKKFYDAVVYGNGNKFSSYKDAIECSYSKDIYDEFIEPCILDESGIISDGDGLIMANFRPDRITQSFSALTNPDFDFFDVKHFSNIKLVTMMPVSDSVICTNMFSHDIINNSLGEVLSSNDYRVLRISEVAKFPHVTHFFDGDKDIDFSGTEKVLIPSKDVFSYDLAPEMSSFEVTDYILNNGINYDFIIVNYANGDMVGHTGNFEAAISAMEALDKCLGKLYDFCIDNDYLLVILADHGNCEEMIDSFGNKLTAHTTNKVKFIVCGDYSLLPGKLSDVAPSVLNILGLPIPLDMTGNIIINKA